MERRALTREEKFILTLYHRLRDLEKNDFINQFEIGNEIGVSSKNIKNILNQLAQANFIKKKGDDVTLTEQGLRLAEELHQESIG